MDDFSENREKVTEGAQESTIFSAPEEHTEKVKSPKKKKIIAVISAFLAVCILVGGTLAVIKLIPEKDQNNISSNSNEISVTDFNKDKFDAVTVKNANGEFVFYPKTVTEESDGKSETFVDWYLKDTAEDKISTSKTSEIMSAAASISATMEITKKTFEECGLGSPYAVVSVNSSSLGDFTLTFGDVSPDNFGIYLHSSIDDKIYLVSQSVADSFAFNAIDLAGTDAILPVSVETKSEDYVDESGGLISFDKFTISGGDYEKPIVIIPISEEDSANVGFAYRVISPVEKYADSTKVTAFFNAFATGITVSGVYSLDTDVAALKQFGLDTPDIVLELKVDKQTFTYKFALQSDGFYALFGDGINTIKKVSASAAEFIGVKESDIYNKTVYIKNISEIKNITFMLSDKTYSFDISENDEGSEEKYTVYYGKKLIKSENFQNFYMQFVSMSLIDFSYGNVGDAGITVKITDNNGNVQTLAFYKASATEYYCSLDNKPVGRITSATYNKLLSNIKAVSENKNVGD